ncbi:MAG: hypothetical protein FJ265_05850 [Planctomycetes bacterium]|nr:hypothetical protein [Planctomycetota bacterium]
MRAWIPCCVLLGAAACSGGTGSDVGPRLPRLPDASCKVSVFDDQGRGVVGASVGIVGTSVRALTGRNGRADLLADPRGSLLLQIDGAAAAASAGDALGTLRVLVSSPGGDLPWPFHLPDVQASTGGPIPVGLQAGNTVIDDGATSGARVTIWNGSSLGLPDGAPTVTVRTGSLRCEHLPGTLPTSGTQAVLFGRGIYLDPPAFTCAPGLTLDVADDLDLGSRTALLYHLDRDLGVWGYVDTGIPSTGGRLVSTGAIVHGGLYAFGVVVDAGAVRGRVVDASTPPLPLPDVAVLVDGRPTRTAGDGTFLVERVPATLASGLGRTVAVEAFAGGSWLPARTATTAAMSPFATIDVGTLVLDTLPAGNLRVLAVTRGRAEPMRRCAVSSLLGSVALVTATDREAVALFEDLPSRWFGFQDGRPLDRVNTYYAQAVGYAEPGRRWTDAGQFFDERGWFIGSRRTRAVLTDARGGGPLLGAALVRGSADGQGFVGATREAGTIFVDRPMDGRATATFESQRDGRTVVHAFTIDTPNGEHIELPLRQVLRTALGAYDRHGIVQGTLVGADPGREHRLRATRRLELQEWWEDVVEGKPLVSSLPVDVDPATTHGAFRAGIAAAGGHLAVAELTGGSGVATLLRVGVAADLEPGEGAVLARDVELAHAATAPFLVPQGLVGLDPAIGVADLSFALALEQPSGRAIDVVRGVGGNHLAVGTDLRLDLPELAGELAGHRWCAVLQGSAVAGGATLAQRTLVRLPGSGAAAATPMLPVPAIVAPAAGAFVAASGFTVEYTLPAGALYATIELRSEAGGELYLWDVVLPPSATSFAFKVLPPEAVTPLVAGRSYTLTVSACRTLAGPMVGKTQVEAYRELTSFLQSLGALERGVDAVSSRTITVTAN